MEDLAVPVLELRDFFREQGRLAEQIRSVCRLSAGARPVHRTQSEIDPAQQRAMVRKGIQNELRSEIDDGIDRLYRIYAESVHRLGTPVFAKSYFRILREEFPQSSNIITVVYAGKAVASVLNFYFRDEVVPFYGGGVRAARMLAANDFMYWEVMRRAVRAGYRIFDFGRSKVGTDPMHSTQLGIRAHAAHLSIPPGDGRSLPDLNPLNPSSRS